MIGTLPELAVEVEPIVLTECDVDDHIAALRRSRAAFTDVERPAVVGDVVRVDLHATVDGTEFDRGRAEDVSHEVGTGHPLPGLDEAVVGLRPGGSTTIRTRLVGGDLAGREADLTITVRAVSEPSLPPVDDRFARQAAGVDSVAELRAQVGARLARQRGLARLRAAQAKVLASLVAAADLSVPDDAVRAEAERDRRALVTELDRVGASFPQYLAVTGVAEADLDTALASAAGERLRAAALLDMIAATLPVAPATTPELRRALAMAAALRSATIREAGTGRLLTVDELAG